MKGKTERDADSRALLVAYLDAIAPTAEPDWLLALNCNYIYVGGVDGEDYSEGE